MDNEGLEAISGLRLDPVLQYDRDKVRHSCLLDIFPLIFFSFFQAWRKYLEEISYNKSYKRELLTLNMNPSIPHVISSSSKIARNIA